MICQRTLSTRIHASGVGLHSGKMVNMSLCPAPPDTGVVFRRVDCDPVVHIPATTSFVGETILSTSLSRDGVSISTVEHLLAALASFALDNVYIDLDQCEVPIMDGSAYAFVFLLKSAGIEEQNAQKKFLRVLRDIEVRETEQDGNEKWARFSAHDGFKVSFRIAFGHKVFTEENTYAEHNFSTTAFVHELSRARTFGFKRDAEMLRKRNLGLGSSLNNVILFDEYDCVNREGLRFADECVKHKILDVIGDLYLLGYNLIGAYAGYRSGHVLNNRLLQLLLDNQDAWEIVSFDDWDEVPVTYAQVGVPMAPSESDARVQMD